MVSSATIYNFLNRFELYEHLRVEGLLELERALGGLGDRVYKKSGRVKSPYSFVIKAEQRGLKRPLADMTDIVGLRAVCLFRSDLSIASQAVRDAFIVVHEEDKTAARHDESVFNYEDIQFVVRLPRNLLSDPDLARFRFEIQLRTLAMDTWATISHMVAYKEASPLPPDLGHELYATNAMLWVADRTFDQVHRFRTPPESPSPLPVHDADPLNPTSLFSYIATRFADRHPTSGGARHDRTVLEGCVLAGARTIGDLRILVDTGLSRIAERVQEIDDHELPSSKRPRAPMPAWWVVTEALRAASPTYSKYLNVSARRAHVEDRAEALSRMPFSPAAYAELVWRLAERLEKESCDSVSLRITREILADMKLDIPSAVQWLESLGGYCDCEVLMNVEARVSDLDEE